MENFNNNKKDMVNKSGKVWAGLFVVGVGCLLLVDNVVMGLPNWLFSWHTFLIALGLFVGAKHQFRGGGWFIMVLVGLFFTIDAAMPRDFHASKILFPAMLVILGLFLIFKPKSKYCDNVGQFKNKKRKKDDLYTADPSTFTSTSAQAEPAQANTSAPANDGTRNDFIDSVNVFGGSQQIIYSKNFKGGEITAVFGGCDVNLSQADFEGEIVLEVTAVFGGAKIIIPQGWLVKHEVTAILGGLDDKRAIQPLQDGVVRKVLIIKGLAMFGGIEIRNY